MRPHLERVPRYHYFRPGGTLTFCGREEPEGATIGTLAAGSLIQSRRTCGTCYDALYKSPYTVMRSAREIALLQLGRDKDHEQAHSG